MFICGTGRRGELLGELQDGRAPQLGTNPSFDFVMRPDTFFKVRSKQSGVLQTSRLSGCTRVALVVR